MGENVDRDVNHALRARFDEVYGQYQQLRSGLAELRTKLEQLRVTERSADGRVTVTVGARGDLVSVELDPAVYQDRDATKLGRTVTDTVRRASARAVASTQELAAGYLPAGSGSLEFLRTGDFGALLARADAAPRP
ncbi:YbaB/EbfC family nucleoid-associated protein [Micromonospora sp. NPDC049366]|uniref:YbaB/EbfC family nucleoid-associated protein n=1 Tax=Micromonospora sp. NPDC049366 TaxID=3364271 RepID=UPI0037B515E7